MSMNMDDALTAARDRLAQLRQEAHIAAAETARIAAQIEQRTYSATSRGREVRVTVGPDALIRRVEFLQDEVTLSPRSLRSATLDAHTRAIALLRSSIDDAAASAPDSVRGLADEIVAGANRVLPADPWRDDVR